MRKFGPEPYVNRIHAPPRCGAFVDSGQPDEAGKFHFFLDIRFAGTEPLGDLC